MWSPRPQIIEQLGRLLMGARLRTGFAAAALVAMAHVLLSHLTLSDAESILLIVPVLVAAMLSGSAAGALAGALAADGKYRDLAAELRVARAAAHAAAVSDSMRGAREPYIGNDGSSTATAGSRPALAAPDSSLTAREEEVLRLVAEGLLNKEIAGTLDISVHTVKTHVRVILSKLDVSNQTGAVGVARDLAILD